MDTALSLLDLALVGPGETPFDALTGRPLSPGDLGSARVEWRVGEDWPADVRAWLEGGRSLADRPAGRDWSILSPREGATYRLLDLPGGTGRVLPLRVQEDPGEYYWFVDGIRLAEPRWEMTPGEHVVSCADASGRQRRVRITVE